MSEKMRIFASVQKVKDMKHLNQMQRYEIFALWQKKCSQTEIAAALNVSKSTISRELKRGRRRGCDQYDPAYSEARHRKFMRNRKKKKVLTREMTAIIKEKLEHGFSPEQIKGYCNRREIPMVSHECIYQLIWEDKRRGGTLYTNLRRRLRFHSKRGFRKKYRGSIPNRVDISERPVIVDEKLRFGDFEGDTVVGRNHKGGLVTLTDRATGLLLMDKVPDFFADTVAECIVRLLKPFKTVLHTLTLDNGREFANHEDISKQLGLDVYFARPYSPGDRGLNENTNGLIRQYFPKRTDLWNIPSAKIKHVGLLINNRPRKRFNFFSPIEIFLAIFANRKFNCDQIRKVAL